MIQGVAGLGLHHNSLYNNWRFDDVWLDKYPSVRVTDRMHACQSMIRRKQLSKRVRILHAFFSCSSFQTPSKGESNPSTLEYILRHGIPDAKTIPPISQA
jgi:hypothetical protein